MGIKVKNCEKDSHLRKDYIPFGVLSTASSISNAQVIMALVPNKGVVKRAVITGTCASACAGDAIHVIVTNGTSTTVLIDNAVTGACGAAGVGHAFAEYDVAVFTATAYAWASAGTVVTINISASEIAGSVVGYLEVELDKGVK